MPNRNRRVSVVDMLAKVPVHRGSLLKSIENLLKTIESSESSVMIPTLLKDKVRVDAWELLFVAKILKASILGHTDLVEFYMNHIGHSSASLQQVANASSNSSTINGSYNESPLLSPSTFLRQSSLQSPTASPTLDSMGNVQTTPTNSSANQQTLLPPSPSLSRSSTGSVTTAQQSLNQSQQSIQQSSRSSNTWMTATSNQQSATSISVNSATSGSTNTTNSSSSTSETNSNGSSNNNQTNGAERFTDQSSANTEINNGSASLTSPTRSSSGRQAQPPSLLQLTTTNNHINSVSGFSNNSIEQLSNQLTSMQQQSSPTSLSNGITSIENALSISTSTANQQTSPLSAGILPGPANSVNQSATTAPQSDLRSSRSAGCLFRMNSGASSPRTPVQTPTTPYPQAETLANGQVNGLSGDPSAPVKLLLQIEQLKTSICHVTSLLDSVVELYKKSIDSIAQ